MWLCFLPIAHRFRTAGGNVASKQHLQRQDDLVQLSKSPSFLGQVCCLASSRVSQRSWERGPFSIKHQVSAAPNIPPRATTAELPQQQEPGIRAGPRMARNESKDAAQVGHFGHAEGKVLHGTQHPLSGFVLGTGTLENSSDLHVSKQWVVILHFSLFTNSPLGEASSPPNPRHTSGNILT